MRFRIASFAAAFASAAAAFASAAAVAFAILPFGLVSPLAIPAALVLGALASGLGAWLADGRRRAQPTAVLASSLASLVLAVPVGALLVFGARASLSVAAPVVLVVVAAASAFAASRRGPREPGGRAAGGRAGRPAGVVAAVAALLVLAVLLLPAGELGYGYLTACRGEERAVFEEFPQYGPRTPHDLDPRPDLNAYLATNGGCYVDYRTPDGASDVTEHFEGRLEENGWRQPPGTSVPLAVRRGEYEYRVTFINAPDGSAQGTRVTVLVREVP